MEIIRHEIPFESEGYLNLLGRIFGPEEKELERIQVNGSENPWNTDIAFTAEEGGVVYGTSHVTFSKKWPAVCGFSGLSADPEVRGRGIGKQLFGAMVEEAVQRKVTAAFLGTNNAMASEIYAGFGFAYIPGTYTMARFFDTNRYRFFRQYEENPVNFQILPMDPSLRISVIPLLLNEGPGYLLDSNAGVFNNRCITQVSTMGLYPKFLDITGRGGKVYMAVSEEGLCGGVASAVLRDNQAAGDKAPLEITPAAERAEAGETLADFFVCKGFECAAQELIRQIEQSCPAAAFRISQQDTEKMQILSKLGYGKTRDEETEIGGLRLTCGLWTKKS